MDRMFKTAKVETDSDHLDFRYEFARKAIHLSSLLIPLIYWHIGKKQALLILTPVTAGFFLVDVAKHFVPFLSTWYHSTFGTMLRHHELNRERLHLNGATWITLAAFALIAFFPKTIAVAAFAMVSVSDTVAALVGKRFGRHRFGQKSFEGSLAFFVSALPVVLSIPGMIFPAAIVMAITGTITEALVLKIGVFRIDDNFSVPLAGAIAGLCCYTWFFPEALKALAH
ncbi:MAG TPA: phosphatidate cytidylyltransferase [Chlorobaculum sp.]|uniref:Membrane protein n=1 Tax=Chlorobaculum tepidum (strain ATCC 49652 / DSM 12025 / NBRC 103806 / TLS) TaxID=194439 RepID=Q8KBR9_CHLTE|nr:diacylglycerol/polyprenol kinase family protein [Chlorobaculum tepidum]AAM72938.1 membrane protein [Chlorobaculum tepidum TLS]HBU22566.1 phosphatidate cytidylyltransferase [Chlorobaculum sp.]